MLVSIMLNERAGRRPGDGVPAELVTDDSANGGARQLAVMRLLGRVRCGRRRRGCRRRTRANVSIRRVLLLMPATTSCDGQARHRERDCGGGAELPAHTPPPR